MCSEDGCAFSKPLCDLPVRSSRGLACCFMARSSSRSKFGRRFSNQRNSLVRTPQTVQREGWFPSNPAQRINNPCRLAPITPKDPVHLQNGDAVRRALEQLRHQIVGGNVVINLVEDLCFLRRSDRTTEPFKSRHKVRKTLPSHVP